MIRDAEQETTTQFDVIIVGGRPAGATLAARLGQAGVRVLLLERVTFPSVPAASCPVIYAGTMALLDEIGADEREYARDTPRLRRWVTEVRDDYRTFNAIPVAHGRDYGYALDRARFDDALWAVASRQPTVTGRQGFSVTDLVWEEGRVTGVRGHAPGGPEEVFTAGCVVGADGRFSLVARLAEAATLHEEAALPTTLYYAYWRNVAPYDAAGPSIYVYGPGTGYGFLVAESADGLTCVCVEGQSALLEPGEQKADAFYLGLLQQYPRVWQRLAGAAQVTKVHGMRKVGNLYRTAGGPGWALVGDALHQKDPLDGQGIYDAVFTAKALSAALVSWQQGTLSWEAALSQYDTTVQAETFPMYQVTMERVKNEVYTARPDWMFRSMLRWITDDPAYKRRLGLLLVRDLAPVGWLPRRVLLAALLRGALGDLGRWLTRRPRRNALPPASALSVGYS